MTKLPKKYKKFGRETALPKLFPAYQGARRRVARKPINMELEA